MYVFLEFIINNNNSNNHNTNTNNINSDQQGAPRDPFSPLVNPFSDVIGISKMAAIQGWSRERASEQKLPVLTPKVVVI